MSSVQTADRSRAPSRPNFASFASCASNPPRASQSNLGSRLLSPPWHWHCWAPPLHPRCRRLHAPSLGPPYRSCHHPNHEGVHNKEIPKEPVPFQQAVAWTSSCLLPRSFALHLEERPISSTSPSTGRFLSIDTPVSPCANLLGNLDICVVSGHSQAHQTLEAQYESAAQHSPHWSLAYQLIATARKHVLGITALDELGYQIKF